MALIGTGGTLSTISRHELDLFDYGDAATILEPQALPKQLPQLGRLVDLVPISFRAMDSLHITRSDWLALERTIREVVIESGPFDGIVVTHGTGTLEETAYFLNLTVKTPATVTLVGAFQPWNTFGSDGPLNLLNAVRVAIAPQAKGCGVLTLLQNEIHAARDVGKEIGFRSHGFRSPELGMLGWVGPDGVVSIYRRPTRLHTIATEFDLRNITSLPRVEIVSAYAEAGREAIDAFAAAGVQGVVVAGFATGRPAPLQEDALETAYRRGMRIFLSTRSGHSTVPRHGSLSQRGFVSADNLSPPKARVLAMLGLAVTDDPRRLQEIFDRY